MADKAPAKHFEFIKLTLTVGFPEGGTRVFYLTVNPETFESHWPDNRFSIRGDLESREVVDQLPPGELQEHVVSSLHAFSVLLANALADGHTLEPRDSVFGAFGRCVGYLDVTTNTHMLWPITLQLRLENSIDSRLQIDQFCSDLDKNDPNSEGSFYSLLRDLGRRIAWEKGVGIIKRSNPASQPGV
jgi:hypothetical protein